MSEKESRKNALRSWFDEAFSLDAVGCKPIPKALQYELQQKFEHTPEYKRRLEKFNQRWQSPGEKC